MEVCVTYERSDAKKAAFHGRPAQFLDAINIDHMRRVGEAVRHHRNETLASCNNPTVVARFSAKERYCLFCRARAMVREWCRFHRLNLQRPQRGSLMCS